MAGPVNPDTFGISAHSEAGTVHANVSEQVVAPRVGWDEYFMNIARQVATRSTCSRKHVGALIVKNRMILATGYNGSLRGLAHCDDVGHLMENGHCVRTVHAEANAIVQAARSGISLEGADIYVTASPCFNCFKLIANAGISKIAYGEFYRDEKIYTFASEMRIELVEVKVENSLVP